MAVAVGLVAGACSQEPLPPRGNVLLYVDTDALVPGDPAERVSATEPKALFDRLVVEVYEPNAASPCIGCRRDFAINRRMFLDSRVSIQVPSAPGISGYRVRARLFLAAHVADGSEPPPNGTIEVVASLPAVGTEGSLEQTVLLATEDVGSPRGTLASPIPTTAGRPASSKVGSWPGGAIVPCPDIPPPGEACVPGGAFWMGRPGELAELAENASDRARLVVVPPHYVDANEVTVADIRSFESTEPGIRKWSGTTDGDTSSDFCTFSTASGPRDALPVSCVYWPTARHYCLSKDKDLPTEAEFEHVAGAMASRRFVWGDDPPECGDAVWGHGGSGYLAQIVAPCRAKVHGPSCIGPTCEAGRSRDALSLEGATVRDLVGNLSEWSLDRFNRQDEACWSPPGVRRDPVCTLPGSADGFLMSLRGGSWLASGRALAASNREGQGLDIAQPVIGFRCARRASTRACGRARPGLYAGATHGGDSGTLFTVGVGCSGVVSALAVHADGGVFLLVGTVDEGGRVHLEGSDIAVGAKVVQRFDGVLTDETHMGGSWTAGDGKSGTWAISPKH
jgi:formylglycine-generating enzyme